MGIQSTQHISRSQAESLWVEKHVANFQESALLAVKGHDNETIENFIKSAFDNYIIKREE